MEAPKQHDLFRSSPPVHIRDLCYVSSRVVSRHRSSSTWLLVTLGQTTVPKHVDILRFFAQPKEGTGSHQVLRDQIARRVRFLVGNLSPTLCESPDDHVRRRTHLTPRGVCLRVFPQSDQITAGASSLPPSPPSLALLCSLPFSIPSPETLLASAAIQTFFCIPR